MTLSALVLLILLAPAPALTQWLGPHLDAQRSGNLRKHQQRIHSRNAGSEDKTTSKDKAKSEDKAAPKLTASERQAAWSRHKTEYRKRLVLDGRKSADSWLERTAVSER